MVGQVGAAVDTRVGPADGVGVGDGDGDGNGDGDGDGDEDEDGDGVADGDGGKWYEKILKTYQVI